MLSIIVIISAIGCAKTNPENPQNSDTDYVQSDNNSEKPTNKPTDKETDEVKKPTNTVSLTSLANRVEFSKPALPANAGEEVDLAGYSVQLTARGKFVSPKDLTWSSDDLTVNGGKVTPPEKGLYKLRVTDGSDSLEVFLIAKNSGEDEYVLYYNNFSDEDSISDFKKIFSSSGANYYIQNGRLILNASASQSESIRLLLPEWLSAFGDYTISTDATITEKANSSRWMSLMFRVQDGGQPYYQMCVRANASDNSGVEIAHYKPDGSWGYYCRTKYTSNLTPDKLVKMQVKVYGNEADIYFNGKLIDGGFGLSDYTNGAIGLQASGSTAVFDSIKVTVEFDQSNNVIMPPTVITRVESEFALDSLLVSSPDIAMMNLDASGNITDAYGNVICTALEAVSKRLPEGVIPAFYLSDLQSYNTADIISVFNALPSADIMIVSKNTELVRELRNKNPSLLGVIDFNDYDWPDGLISARSAANSAGARICLLPTNMANQTITEYFNVLNMTVWYESSDDSITDAFRLITSGANGIIANDRVLLEQCLASSVFEKNSILRPVSVIGHRGMPSYAPENTLEGSILAARYGANVIENDIYITTDGVIVVMHDANIDRTTTGTGNIESYSYEELSKFYVSDTPDESSGLDGKINSRLPIPTLESYLSTFDGTDTSLFIEIKSAHTDRLIPELKRLLDKYTFYDQCNVICFSDSTLKALKREIPELSVGYLCGTSDRTAIMNKTSECESSFNPSVDCVSAHLVRYLATRGIFTWPWTVNDNAMFDSLILCGVAGITTNYALFAQNYVKRISVDNSSYIFKAGGSVDVNVFMELYGAEKDAADFKNIVLPTNKAEMVIIEGNSTLSFDEKSVSATEDGKATVIFRLPYQIANGETVYVYTQPINITVSQ